MAAVVVVDAETITVRGPQVRECLRHARMRPIYVGTSQGWMLDRRRLPDALAALQRASYAVRLEGDPVPSTSATPVVSDVEPHLVREDGLW